MKRIALVAHDSRKEELKEWVEYNKHVLMEHELYATGTTGGIIERQVFTIESEEDPETHTINLIKEKNINKLLSGPLGGDSQIGAMIAEGKIDCLIFFCDNLIIQGHNSDIMGLTRLASLYNVAFATNRTTADMIISSPLFNDDDYESIKPGCIEKYSSRKL